MSDSNLRTIITMGSVGFEPFDKVGPVTFIQLVFIA